MDRDDFIITVYCLVCEHYKAVKDTSPLRRGGVAPMLTDEEVITIEICGEYLKLGCDKDIYDYFRAHYRHFFPCLTDRTLFVRQAANLWLVKAAIQRRLIIVSGQIHDPVQVIDTLPMPVCGLTRGRRDRCFKPWADYGYCAAKDQHYYGFKLGLRMARSGMITWYPLLPARPHDIQLLDDLVENFAGLAPADKGFLDAFRQALLAERHGVLVVTPPRKGMTTPLPAPLLRFCKRVRKLIETVGSHLTERFGIGRIRVHDVWHFQHRLIRKILAHTVGVFLNLQLGRPPLDLDGLLAV
ncbi:MAG: IS982 family transposase [Candidatus Tectomicrobia bacterium]|nr:IS982 family transposase [Candidatus Tectomicrobia bacterium]